MTAPGSGSPRRSTRIAFVAALLLALIGTCVWWLRDDDTRASSSPAAPASNRASAEPAPEKPLVQDAPVAPALRTAVTAEPTPAPTPAAVPEPEHPDLEVRDWLGLRVVDERQQPIFDAEVAIRGIRKQGEEGSWYSMRGGETKARTDREGRARVDYTRWVDIDGKTVRVDLVVAHPDFITFNDNSYLLAPGEQIIVLNQGTTLWLTAWHGSPDRVVSDVKIQVEWNAQLDADGWTRERDGRWSTTRLAPGPHWVTVTHESAELGKLASDFTVFELFEHARLDLALELKPLVALRGRLDDSVPRPIVGGHVKIDLHATANNQGLASDHESTIAADGTFTIEGVRAASGQIIAVCDGWVSKLVPPRTLEQTSVRLMPDASEADRNAALARAREAERIAQPIDVAAEEALVVEMEPTGVLEVRVVDKKGVPLAGARVTASPNVFWVGVGSSIFPWRDWSAVADAKGIARIAELPPDEMLWYGVHADGYRMQKRDRDVNPFTEIQSGKVARCKIALEKTP